MSERKTYQLYGIDWYYFIIIGAILAAAVYMGFLPAGMTGAYPLMIIIGAVLNEIGNKTPFVKSYLGGGAIVVIFGCAALVYFNLIPTSSTEIMTNFMKGEGFLDFYIAALITGSILGMDRKLLIKAAIRYLPAIIGGVACAALLTGIVGAITGYGAVQAIFYICIPIMGGGMGAGAVPLSQIFGNALDTEPDAILSVMIPAVALGNALAIVAGGLLNKLGKSRPKLTGNGQMLISYDANTQAGKDADSDGTDSRMNNLKIENLGIGLLVSTAFMVWGNLVAYFIPGLHYYAWMILSIALVKALGVMPQQIEYACFQWFQFVMKNLTIVLLAGIGIAYTDLGEIIAAFSPIYVLLVFTVVFGAVLGSALVGRLVGFFPIEASITAGLCMANMGGTGDVAVLSASERMELMPFAQISSRLGGAFMLVLSSVLLQFIA